MSSMFENYITASLEMYGSTTTRDAMAYSLLGGGKRLRPAMMFALVQDLNLDPEISYPAACALEMIHTYSLVHDDLPAMDNDDFRRHKPTNHKVYGEGQAILAGDALLTGAFEHLSYAPLDADKRIALIQVLSRASGALGMILGQEYDTEDNIHTIDDLNRCYELKTGCLFAASLEMACIVSNRSDLQSKAHELGLKLGVAFQYQDDILEVSQAFETIGKSISSDLDRDKATAVSLLGLEKAKNLTHGIFDEITQLIASLNLSGNNLLTLIQSIIKRDF